MHQGQNQQQSYRGVMQCNAQIANRHKNKTLHKLSLAHIYAVVQITLKGLCFVQPVSVGGNQHPTDMCWFQDD